MSRHYTVKLYEDDFDTLLHGLNLLKGSTQYMFTVEKLIAKIESKRDKLKALNVARSKYDKAPRKQHDRRLQDHGNGSTAAQDNAPRFNGASGVSVRLGVGPESKDAV